MKIDKKLLSGQELIIKIGKIEYPISEFVCVLNAHFITFSDLSVWFSISKDDKTYTDWELILESDWFESLTTNIPLFIKLKLSYTSVVESSITISDITLTQTRPKTIIAVQGESIALSAVTEESLMNYAEMGEGLVKLETDLNYYLNKHNGIEVDYFHTNPDVETKDDFLKEYSLYNVVDRKVVKVVVTDNKTPIPKHEFSQWGIEFEKLEIYFEKTYFEEEFGINEAPKPYDYIYFRELNRMYYIEDMYLEHGINEVGTYHVCVIKKYEDISAVAKDEDSLDFLKEHIDVLEFTDEQKNEIKDTYNPQQNIEKDIIYDNVRTLVSEKVIITKDMFDFKSGIISKYFYDMLDTTSEIIYKPLVNLDFNSGMSIMFWIRPIITDAGKPNEAKLAGKLLSIGGNFDLYVNDDTKDNNFNLPQSYNGFYCVVVSINNQFNIMSKFVYEMAENGLERIDYSSIVLGGSVILNESIMKLHAGNYNIRCVRLSNYVIQDQYHQYIMLAKNIKKASAFTIIDDCEPITNLRKIKKSVFPNINRETFGDVI